MLLLYIETIDLISLNRSRTTFSSDPSTQTEFNFRPAQWDYTLHTSFTPSTHWQLGSKYGLIGVNPNRSKGAITITKPTI